MEPETTKANPARKRRSPRVSLRSAMVLITVLCLWLGWYASSAQRQSRAVGWLRSQGCFIGYDYQIQTDGGDRVAQPATAAWLSNLLGPDYFHRVVKVRFEQPLTINDAVMDRLKDLPGLRHLEARHCPLDSSIEPRLAEWSRLEDLELEECALNDRQLAALGKLPNLRELNLQHNPFQGTGLAAWEELDKLETLYLSDTALCDENLVHLSELANLQRLYLGDTQLGDVGLAQSWKDWTSANFP
jgi:hypothetical protein